MDISKNILAIDGTVTYEQTALQGKYTVICELIGVRSANIRVLCIQNGDKIIYEAC